VIARAALGALVCAAALAGTAALTQGRGHGGWHTERVGRLGGKPRDYAFYRDVALAGNARGRRVLAWFGRGGLRAAAARPGHDFGPGRLVKRETTDVGAIRIAMSSRGDALILWSYDDRSHIADPNTRDEDCCYGARVVVLRRDGRLGRVRTLTRRGVDVDVAAYAIDRSVRYGVVFTESTYEHPRSDELVGRFSGHRGLGPVRKVDPYGYGLAMAFVHGRPRVLMWVYGKRHARLLERVAHHNGRFGARRVVARGLPAEPQVVAVANERGDEAVAWTNESSDRPLHAGTRAAGKPLRAHVVAGTEQPDPGTLAIARSGAAALTWSPYRDGWRLSTSRGRGSPFRGQRVVVPRRRLSFLDQVALGVDSRRRVALAWLDRSTSVRALAIAPDGRRLRHARFAAGKYAQLGGDGRASFDEHERATFAWSSGTRIRAAHVRVDP
jgi:hypothetical protein